MQVRHDMNKLLTLEMPSNDLYLYFLSSDTPYLMA